MTLPDLLNASGHGRCVITLDPARQAAGPAAVSGYRAAVGRATGRSTSMAEVLEHYMHHSEQLDTRMWLAANTERAVGMLLQKLPGDGGIVPHPGELTRIRGSASARSAARCRRTRC